MRQSSGQLSFGSTFPSSQVSGASSTPLPQTAVGAVVVVVEVVGVVVVVCGSVVLVVVVGGAVLVVVVVVDVVVGGDVLVVVLLAVVLVVVVLLVVVVVASEPSRAAMAVVTHASTSSSIAAESPSGGRQSLRDLFSSFAKQPFAGSSPPSNFARTLSMQPLVFGSSGFPGFCAFSWHLRRPLTLLAMHFFLPAPHFD